MPDFKFQNLDCSIQHLQSFDQLIIKSKNEEIRVNFTRHLWPDIPLQRPKPLSYKIAYPTLKELEGRDMRALDKLIWDAAGEAKKIFYAGHGKTIHPKN